MRAFIYSSLLIVFSGFVGLAQSPVVGGCSVLPADNIWNTPVDQLSVHPSSSTWVNTIGPTIGVHPDFGGGVWNGGPMGIPFVTVPGTQTRYPATFTYPGESDPGPYAIPLDATIEGGSASTGDRHVISIETGNCILYEIFYAFPQASSWQGYSGAIFDLKSNALRPSTWTSADAAGLPILVGLLRWEDIAAGEIRHAIRFTVPQTQRAFVWPARHYASSLTGAQYPPMGARFRLRANFDISGYSATNQIILKAMKKYGMMLADNGSAWYITGAPSPNWNDSDLHTLGNVKGSDFEAVDVSPLMVNVNSGQALQPGISVSVSPGTASVPVTTTKQFTATVNGTANQSVTWDVNGFFGGTSTIGTITAAGLYAAPSAIPSPGSVTIHATSAADTSKFGTATATITSTPPPPPPPPGSVAIFPASAKVRISRTLQFAATVSNAANKTVTWNVNNVAGGNATVGTISSGGLYKAPASVPSPAVVAVKAVSVQDPTKSASASVTVSRK